MIAFVFEILMSRPTRLATLSTLRSKVSAFSHNRDIVCIIQVCYIYARFPPGAPRDNITKRRIWYSSPKNPIHDYYEEIWSQSVTLQNSLGKIERISQAILCANTRLSTVVQGQNSSDKLLRDTIEAQDGFQIIPFHGVKSFSESNKSYCNSRRLVLC